MGATSAARVHGRATARGMMLCAAAWGDRGGAAGAEKSVEDLKRVVEGVPGAVLALVGEGPCRSQLEDHFRGLPVVFTVTSPQP